MPREERGMGMKLSRIVFLPVIMICITSQVFAECLESDFMAKGSNLAAANPWFSIIWNKMSGNIIFGVPPDLPTAGGQWLDGKLYLNLAKPGRTTDDIISTFVHESMHGLGMQGCRESRAFYVQLWMHQKGLIKLSPEMLDFVAKSLDGASWQDDFRKLPSGRQPFSVRGVGSHPTITGTNWRRQISFSQVYTDPENKIWREWIVPGKYGDRTVRDQIGLQLPNGKRVFCDGRPQVAGCAAPRGRSNSAPSQAAATTIAGVEHSFMGLWMMIQGMDDARNGFESGNPWQRFAGTSMALGGGAILAEGVGMTAGTLAAVSTGSVSVAATGVELISGAAVVGLGTTGLVVGTATVSTAVGYGIGQYTTGPAAGYITEQIFDWWYGN